MGSSQDCKRFIDIFKVNCTHFEALGCKVWLVESSNLNHLDTWDGRRWGGRTI